MKSAIAATLLTSAASHGIFWSPTSRAVLSEQSGYMKDATTIISEPMPDLPYSRNYPGNRPVQCVPIVYACG